MPPIVQIIVVLFLALFVFVTLTKKFPVNLTEKQARLMSYVTMGGLAVAIIAGILRSM